ncbi:unnamed protein product, partial [Scytosiphon promiscuus]
MSCCCENFRRGEEMRRRQQQQHQHQHQQDPHAQQGRFQPPPTSIASSLPTRTPPPAIAPVKYRRSPPQPSSPASNVPATAATGFRVLSRIPAGCGVVGLLALCLLFSGGTRQGKGLVTNGSNFFWVRADDRVDGSQSAAGQSTLSRVARRARVESKGRAAGDRSRHLSRTTSALGLAEQERLSQEEGSSAIGVAGSYPRKTNRHEIVKDRRRHPGQGRGGAEAAKDGSAASAGEARRQAVAAGGERVLWDDALDGNDRREESDLEVHEIRHARRSPRWSKRAAKITTRGPRARRAVDVEIATSGSDLAGAR